MSNITIFTDTFATDNADEILRASSVGNLSPIELNGVQSGLKYQSAKGTIWNPDKTFVADESYLENETEVDREKRIVSSIAKAFADLQAGTVEAVTMSVPLFLDMQQRPEFQPNSTVTIYRKGFEPQTGKIGAPAPVYLSGSIDYEVTINDDWAGNIFVPDLTKAPTDVTSDLLAAFQDLIAGNIDGIRVPVSVFLLIQQRPEFNA